MLAPESNVNGPEWHSLGLGLHLFEYCGNALCTAAAACLVYNHMQLMVLLLWRGGTGPLGFVTWAYNGTGVTVAVVPNASVHLSPKAALFWLQG